MNFKNSVQFSAVTRVWLFATPWTAACQASLSITNSWSLLKLTSIQLMMPSTHTILCHPILLPPSVVFQHQELFQWVSSSHQVVSRTIRASYVLGEMHTCLAVTLAKVFQFYLFFFLKNNNKLSRRFIIGDFSMECPRWSW